MVSANFYSLQLVVLGVFTTCALILEKYGCGRRQRGASSSQERTSLKDGLPNGNGHAHGDRGWKMKGDRDYKSLMWNYLVVYTIVMGADWLQGPYVYSLYHEQYEFPERTVAILFVIGFLSAGVFAPIVGPWADQKGRKSTCLLFCLTYASSCILISFPWLPFLLAGRVLGGFSTSILFSCFESWFISSSNAVHLSSAEVSSIMGRATLMNGLAATTAGVVSNKLVSVSGSYLSPFWASAVLLGIGHIVIRKLWDENYGSSSSQNGSSSATAEKEKLQGVPNGSTPPSGTSQMALLRQSLHYLRTDPSLMALLLTQTAFEGSMYLFVFLWVPSLQSVSASKSLPLGYIFSSFMISMMLGSLAYSFIASNPRASGTSLAGGDEAESRKSQTVPIHAQLASLVCALSALCFAVSTTAQKPEVRFWAFCMFEACVGVYYPVMGVLRGGLVRDEIRATTYSLFRLPLNVFVTLTLLTGTGDGSGNKYLVWSGCALSLIVASASMASIVWRGAK